MPVYFRIYAQKGISSSSVNIWIAGAGVCSMVCIYECMHCYITT